MTERQAMWIFFIFEVSTVTGRGWGWGSKLDKCLIEEILLFMLGITWTTYVSSDLISKNLDSSRSKVYEESAHDVVLAKSNFLWYLWKPLIIPLHTFDWEDTKNRRQVSSHNFGVLYSVKWWLLLLFFTKVILCLVSIKMYMFLYLFI